VFAFQVRRTTCEGGEWTLRRNVGRFLPNCTASQPKRQYSSGTTSAVYLSMPTSTGGRRCQALPEFDVFLSTSSASFWFIRVVPLYTNLYRTSRPGHGYSDCEFLQTNASVKTGLLPKRSQFLTASIDTVCCPADGVIPFKTKLNSNWVSHTPSLL